MPRTIPPEETATMHDRLAALRHDMRGTLNALKLCISAFDMPMDASEKLEFLSDIESSADKLAGLVDEFEALLASSGAPDVRVAAGDVR
jgi:hypothetical protein